MTSRRTNTMMSSTHNTYSTIHSDSFNNKNNSLRVPDNRMVGRSPSPIGIDANLKDVKKAGKDYHVSVNLNSLLSGNVQVLPPSSSTMLRKNNIINNNKQTLQRSSRTIENQQTLSHNNGFLTDQNHVSPNVVGGSRKTVLTLNGTDDADLYAAYQRQQQQQKQQQQQRYLLTTTPAPRTSTYSLSPPNGSLPRRVASTARDSGYAVKSVSSSNANHFQKSPMGNDKVEFDLHIKGKVIEEVQNQKKKTWEIVGTVPTTEGSKGFDDMAQLKEIKSRRGPREIVDDVDNSEDWASRMDERTTQELEDLVLSHSLIKDTPEGEVKVERDKTRVIGPLNDQQEGLINVDIVTEKVELVLEKKEARVAVKVRCERILPLEGSDDLFKKSGVLAVKSMDFDMTETDARWDIYEQAVQRQNQSPDGRLEQSEISELYRSLMDLVEREKSGYSAGGDHSSRRARSGGNVRMSGGGGGGARSVKVGGNNISSSNNTRRFNSYHYDRDGGLLSDGYNLRNHSRVNGNSSFSSGSGHHFRYMNGRNDEDWLDEEDASY